MIICSGYCYIVYIEDAHVPGEHRKIVVKLHCLALPDGKQVEIGIWGQRHLRYLKEYCKVIYYNLLTSGKRGSYLTDIDKQAEELYELVTEQMKQAQGYIEKSVVISKVICYT